MPTKGSSQGNESSYKDNRKKVTGIWDSIFKLLLEVNIKPLLEHLFPEAGKILNIVIQNVETKVVRTKRKDFVCIVDFELKSYLVHIELQTTNEPKMPQRMFGYAHNCIERYYQQYKTLELVQMVLYVGNKPMQMRNELKWGQIDFRFILTDIRSLPYQLFENIHTPESLILAYLARPETTEAHIEEFIETALTVPERAKEAIEMFLSIIELRPLFFRTAMKKIMEYTDVRQTRGGRYYYEVLLKEQLEKSFQDGKLEGIEKGIEKGKLEIARKLKEKGFSLKDIAELSGLTLEDLQNNL